MNFLKFLKFQDNSKWGICLATTIAMSTAVLSLPVQAQSSSAEYPSKPIRFIVPYTPGGLGDSFARALGQGLSERLGQPVVIENLPGASQAIGAEAAARAPADGHTLFMGTQSGLVLNTIARKKLPYDPVKDFSPVSMLFSTPLFLVVHPSLPAQSLTELIALAKARPGYYSVATIGEGTSTNLMSLMFQASAKIKLLQVPYKGSAPAITDVLSGTVNMMFEGGASALPHVRQGKLRALASSAVKRTERSSQSLPIMSTTLPGLELEPWFGVVAPAGVPQTIIDRLNQEIKHVQRSPRMQDLAVNFGAEIVMSTPEQMGSRISSQLIEFSKVMKDAGVEPN
ncbi:tripartite tricarboxylate transporter substrate binding protein [Limnohabitans sp. 15K]|uniref:Bug family tripartite tricarboxylate transporter substrate binding protein n=1 Tax=Limnohabitans sp. 15K TaxID=1100706 RepID=UPI00130443E1|nr:tripartite tricarboxylate transporter substrate-binding protein [Limnohabitans sp. 15K]